MAGQKPKSASQLEHKREGITRITVSGFKSISQEQSIEVRPLTILAGANSSGKSSIMQPLLLLKQTLEAPYDPGALLLDGPNVQFTLADQLLSRMGDQKVANTFHVGIEVGREAALATYFTRSKSRGKGFEVEQTMYGFDQKIYRYYLGMPQDEIRSIFIANLATFAKDSVDLIRLLDTVGLLESDIVLTRNRCFLTNVLQIKSDAVKSDIDVMTTWRGEAQIGEYIRRIIHLPGLRGNPERTYPVTAVGLEFPGTFENYVASVIGQWQAEYKNQNLQRLNSDLARLGLAGLVVAEPIDDTQVELLVNRFPNSDISDTKDMVSIADVGLGISQALPVVVALHAANEGQLVYLEQPEIHLHPRAQTAMAEVLVDAAIQGKRLVVETHSYLLLLGIQTLVAEGKLPPELVKLHWFTQEEDGSTKITSADLDETGAFGDWPEDFDSVTLHSENRYLNAAEARLRGK